MSGPLLHSPMQPVPWTCTLSSSFLAAISAFNSAMMVVEPDD
jgi:hypothetical protein